MTTTLHNTPQDTEEACSHDLARPVKRSGKDFYYCFECDEHVDPETMDVVPANQLPPEDGEPNAGKAQAPQTLNQNGSGAPGLKSKQTEPEKPRRQDRDQSKMVQVQCQHTDPKTGARCQHLFKVWPQNITLVQYCPQVHRSQHKRELNRQRQKAFRNRRQ